MSIVYGEEGWLVCIADGASGGAPDTTKDRIYIFATQVSITSKFSSQLMVLPNHLNIHIPTGEIQQTITISQGLLLKFSFSEISELWEYIHSHGSGSNATVYAFLMKDGEYMKFIDKNGTPQNYLECIFRDVSITLSNKNLPKIKLTLAEVSL